MLLALASGSSGIAMSSSNSGAGPTSSPPGFTGTAQAIVSNTGKCIHAKLSMLDGSPTRPEDGGKKVADADVRRAHSSAHTDYTRNSQDDQIQEHETAQKFSQNSTPTSPGDPYQDGSMVGAEDRINEASHKVDVSNGMSACSAALDAYMPPALDTDTDKTKLFATPPLEVIIS